MVQRPGAVLAVVVTVAVALGVVAAVAADDRQDAALGRTTPEGVVQAYLEAVLDGDLDEAVALLSEDSGCDRSDVATPALPAELRVVVLGTDVEDDAAVVRVRVTEGGDGLLGDGWTHDERIVLERSGDSWRVSASGWLLLGCQGKG